MTTPRMHAGELVIEPDLVRRLVDAQFPEWGQLELTAVPYWGTDNALYRLGPDMVVRLPRISWAAGGTEKDLTWLPRLAPLLPVAVPVPLAKGEPAAGYPWTWGVYPWLPGETPIPGRVERPEELALEIADFVGALHEVHIPGGPASHRGVPAAQRNRESTPRSLVALSHSMDVAAIAAEWESVVRLPEWTGPPVWLHGDLMPGNLLLEDGTLRAVIDWGDVGVGDPACDCMVAWNLLPASARPAFRSALGVDDATWARGRGWALSQAVVALPYYRETNPTLAAIAQHTLNEVMAERET